MVRHGMVTIGVAVQAEAFSSESRSTNTIESYTNNDRTFSDNPSPPQLLTSSSKSAIFLPPNRNGQSQTLKITFQYNKQNNLPEVVVNYNEEGQDTHVELKELSPHNGRASVISQDYSNPNKKANAVQVYYFEKIDKPYSTQIFEVPPEEDDQDLGTGESTNKVKAIEYYKSEGDTIDSLLPFKPKPKPRTIESTDNFMTMTSKNDDGHYKAPPGSWAEDEKGSKVEEEAPSRNKHKSSSSVEVDKAEEIPKEKKAEETSPEKTKTPTASESGVADEILGKKEPSMNPKKEKSNKNKLGGELRSRRKSTNSNNNNNDGSSPGTIRRSLSPVKDRSKIPVLNSATTGFMPCEYYRKKWLREMGLTGESVNYGGSGYSTIHKTAGQKVVNKLTAQQKKLEEDAAAHRKRTEFIFFDEMILDSSSISPLVVPIRKKQTRLEPLHRTPPKCC